MNGVTPGTFEREPVPLTWSEQAHDPAVQATCWFEPRPIRHVVGKHIDGTEPWGRILGESLVKSLRDAARSGRMPAPQDCHDFVQALARELQSSCARPLLCRFHEIDPSLLEEPGRPQWGSLTGVDWEKVLFVLPSGAVVFAQRMATGLPDVVQLVFLTGFFPRHATGWVAPARAAAAAAERYVLRWAELPHRTGGRLLPEHSEWVPAENEATGANSLQGRFRFVTLETWGFRLQDDDQWVWLGSVPARF